MSTMLLGTGASATSPYALFAGGALRSTADRVDEKRSILETPGIVRDASASVTAAFKTACDAAVAGDYTLKVPRGRYRFDGQLVVKAGLRLELDDDAILIRNFAGSTGNRYDNALIRNERCRTNAAYVGTGGSPVYEPVYPPAATDDGIRIKGGRIRPANSSMIGGGVYFTAVRDLIIEDMTIERTHLDYAWTLGGEGIIFRGNRLLANQEVFEDGCHVVEGDGIWIYDNEINSGDDAIALGIGYNLPIRNVAIWNNKVNSKRGQGFVLYGYRDGVTDAYPPPTRRIENVWVDGLTGTAGWLRNGLMVSELDVPRYTVESVLANTAGPPIDVRITLRADQFPSSEDDFYVGVRATIAGGTGTLGQSLYCTGYVGASRTMSFGAPWTAIDATTQLDFHGALARDIRISNVDLRAGPMSGHDMTNPRGIELSNILRLKMNSIVVNNSIREALKLTSIIGPSKITDFHGGPPQIGGTTYPCVSLSDCPNLEWDGGSAQATANHPIYVQGGWYQLADIQTPELATGASAVNALSLTTNPTDLKLSGMRPSKRAGATSTRLARIGAGNVKIDLDSCDCSKIDEIVFESSPALKRSWRGIITPAAGNVVARPASGNVQLYDRYSETIVTNGGATATVTLALWPGRVGDRHRFRRVASFAFRLDPNGTEIIIGPTSTGGQGKYLELGSNAYVELECVEDGVWQVMTIAPTNATLTFEL